MTVHDRTRLIELLKNLRGNRQIAPQYFLKIFRFAVRYSPPRAAGVYRKTDLYVEERFSPGFA